MGQRDARAVREGLGLHPGNLQLQHVRRRDQLFRYRGIPLDALSGGLFKVYVLLPNLDVRVYGGSGRFAGVIGTSATGLRLANCAVTGCFEASLRVLTVNLWEATDFQQASFAVSLGGNVTVGIKL